MNAVQPHTTHAVVLAVQSVVTIGQAGAWIGPLLVGGLAAALDASAVGAHAWRDRIAVCGYYAAAISFVTLLGLAGWERSMLSDYNWRMAGALASVAIHGALLLAMFGGLIGPTLALSTEVAKKVKFGSDATAKVNQTLLGWTVAAAVTAPMAGTGGWGTVVDAIAAVRLGLADPVERSTPEVDRAWRLARLTRARLRLAVLESTDLPRSLAVLTARPVRVAWAGWRLQRPSPSPATDHH